jgi:hypothetical protein
MLQYSPRSCFLNLGVIILGELWRNVGIRAFQAASRGLDHGKPAIRLYWSW